MSWTHPTPYSRPSSRSPPPRRVEPASPRALGHAHADHDPALTKQVDQIVQHFFAKTLAVVTQSRVTTASTAADFHDLPLAAPSSSRGARKRGEKLNSWFNLTLPENEHFRTELKTWRNISTLLGSPALVDSTPSTTVPTLSISVYLDGSDLTANQVLVLSDQKGRRTRVDRTLAHQDPRSSDRPGPAAPAPAAVPRSRSRGGRGSSQSPTSVVLEEWTLAFDPSRRVRPAPSPPPSHDHDHHDHAPSSSSSSSTSDLGRRPTPTTSPTGSVSLPSVYKHSILHFRSLHTLVKLLPTYSLARKLNRSTHAATGPRRGGGGGAPGGPGGGPGGGLTMTGGLKIGVRVEVRDPREAQEEERERRGLGARDGEVGVDVAIENRGIDDPGRTTETVRFPSVETPLGSLYLSGTYRLNADFGVEDIETLLSSRFIDEDFFRPTVNTARFREKEESGRPGSLPISARGGPSATQSRLGTSPSHPSPPITGLGPLPSYGSLSSRHQYAPQPTSTATGPAAPPLPVPVPLPSDDDHGDRGPRRSIDGDDRSPSVSSSSRLSTYGTSVPTTRGGIVEPAFISLSRARSGSTIPGIPRASPSSYVGGGTSGIIRRTSLSGGGGGGGHSGSPSSGSPIFRPGSYLSNPSGAAFPSSSSSPSFGPPSRQQPQSSVPTAASSSQLTFGNRVSPLSPPAIPSGPSNLGATAPSRPLPLPSSSSSPVAGWSGGIPIRGYSYSSTGGGGGGGGGVVASSGSWSRSYGRGSSDSGGAGGGMDAPGLSRRTSSRLSFGAGAGGPTPGPGPGGSKSSIAPRDDERRFVHEGTAPPDAREIDDFLKLLDETPDLGGLASSRLGGGASAAVASTTVLRKRDVDEQLKALRGSVLGFGPSSTGGGGGRPSSPSPPYPAFALSTASSGGGVGVGGISNLRRQTSRLSIEEEPVECATAVAPADARTTPGGGSEGDESSDNGLTPRPPYRQLRPDLVSPPLSTTSATSTVRHHPHPEPRLYPLPSSSATSPLASPAAPAASAAPSSSFASAVYPPLPYPPATKARASTSTSTRTAPIAFAPYLSRAARLALEDRRDAAASASERTSAAASVSSFTSTQVGDDGDGGCGGSYRGEEEAVGRLELDGDDEDAAAAADDDDRHGSVAARGRTYRGTGDVDEEEISLRHPSRDPTPAAAIRLGGAGEASSGVAGSGASPYRRTVTAAGYFATRSHSRGGVGRRTSPPDSYLA
ncbi:hypothetical protein JCM11491_000287 [Sporobolomyces phaffii]